MTEWDTSVLLLTPVSSCCLVLVCLAKWIFFSKNNLGIFYVNKYLYCCSFTLTRLPAGSYRPLHSCEIALHVQRKTSTIGRTRWRRCNEGRGDSIERVRGEAVRRRRRTLGHACDRATGGCRCTALGARRTAGGSGTQTPRRKSLLS